MNKYLVGLASVTISFFLSILIAIPLVYGKEIIGGMAGGFLYFFVLLFLPFLIISLVSNYLFDWIFRRMTVPNLLRKVTFAMMLTLSISFGYFAISWLILGDLKYLFRESLALVSIGNLVIWITVYLSQKEPPRHPKKK